MLFVLIDSRREPPARLLMATAVLRAILLIVCTTLLTGNCQNVSNGTAASGSGSGDIDNTTNVTSSSIVTMLTSVEQVDEYQICRGCHSEYQPTAVYNTHITHHELTNTTTVTR